MRAKGFPKEMAEHFEAKIKEHVVVAVNLVDKCNTARPTANNTPCVTPYQ